MTTMGKDADGYQSGLTQVNGEPLPPDGAVFRRPTKLTTAEFDALAETGKSILPYLDLSTARRLHGGRRPGAGRKPAGTVQVVVRLTPATRSRLKARAERTGQTLSAVAEAALAKI